MTLKVENFEPTSKMVMVKREKISKSGIVLLDDARQDQGLYRFVVIKAAKDCDILPGSILWVKPHALFMGYQEDKEQDILMIPEQDIAGVLNGETEG